MPIDQSLFQYQFSDTIFLTPGQVTIQCTNIDQLYQQLEFLAKALREHSDDLWKRVAPVAAKRPPGSEFQTQMAAAKTA
ncbi:MAG: hypothetical protein ACJ74Y_02100 [Bryobacteraceae bacterium]